MPPSTRRQDHGHAFAVEWTNNCSEQAVKTAKRH